jgi:hypothetical protein
MSYKKIPLKDASGKKTGEYTDQILRKADNVFIPFDPANKDYQIYSEWLAIDGNEPDPAD